MCDDLIRQHYQHSDASYEVHGELLPGCSVWMVYPSERIWLLLPTPDPSSAVDTATLYRTLDTHFARQDKWTITSYDARIARWATRHAHPAPQMLELVLDIRALRRRPDFERFLPDSESVEVTARYAICVGGAVGGCGAEASGGGMHRFVDGGGEMLAQVVDLKSVRSRGFVLVRRDGSAATADGHGNGRGNGKGMRSRLYVANLQVERSHRRLGLGRWLLKHTVARAAGIDWGAPEEGEEPGKRQIQDWSADEVWLTCFCDNVPALNLYMAMGFRINRAMWVVKSDGKDDETE